MRTTVDIDDPILAELNRLRKKRGTSLGRLVSDLLAQALHRTPASGAKPPPFKWIAKPMEARVDLADREAIYNALERGATR